MTAVPGDMRRGETATIPKAGGRTTVTYVVAVLLAPHVNVIDHVPASESKNAGDVNCAPRAVLYVADALWLCTPIANATDIEVTVGPTLLTDNVIAVATPARIVPGDDESTAGVAGAMYMKENVNVSGAQKVTAGSAEHCVDPIPNNEAVPEYVPVFELAGALTEIVADPPPTLSAQFVEPMVTGTPSNASATAP